MVNKNKNQDFTTRASKIHKNRYNYSLVNYIDWNIPVIIICKKHGNFNQRPGDHIHAKHGCPICGNEKRGRTRQKNNNWWTFEEARFFTHKLQLNCIREWNIFAKSNKRPNRLPSNPKITYKRKWKGWTDWIGKNGRTKLFLTFKESKNIMKYFNLKSYEDWIHFCHLGKRPKNIPFAPFKVYKNDWKSWGNWLGYKSRANGNIPGILYIIQDTNLPINIYKIGRTYRLDKRIYEHTRTNKSTFNIIATYHVSNMKQAEEKAHLIALNIGEKHNYKKSKEYFLIQNIQFLLTTYNAIFKNK